MEANWGAWEGWSLDRLRNDIGEIFAAMEAKGLDLQPPGGESPRMVRARLAEWLAEAAPAQRPMIAVCHAGVVRAAYSLATGWDMKRKAPLARPHRIVTGPDGALWFTMKGGQCETGGGSKIGRITTDGQLTEFTIPTEPGYPGGITAGPDGALWFGEELGNKIGRITTAGGVVRYDAGRLEAAITGGPDAELSLRDAGDARDLNASNLAFDTTGNLWVIVFGGNRLAKIAAADLEGSGARRVVATVTITLGVAALLERPAFDESGGLWLALDQNRFGRLGPEQLGASSAAGAPTLPATIIASPGMGYANRMAFFPAATDLPLYHHFAR